MYYWDKVEEALKYIEKKTSVRPEAAVILGSGLGRAAESIEEPEIIPYEDIPYWPRSTAPGHAGRLVLGRLGGKTVAAMQGRVHYYEGYKTAEIAALTGEPEGTVRSRLSRARVRLKDMLKEDEL